MKVKELIAKLKNMDPDMDVWVSATDGDDLEYSNECDVVEEVYLDDVIEADDDDLDKKIILLY